MKCNYVLLNKNVFYFNDTNMIETDKYLFLMQFKFENKCQLKYSFQSAVNLRFDKKKFSPPTNK